MRGIKIENETIESVIFKPHYYNYNALLLNLIFFFLCLFVPKLIFNDCQGLCDSTVNGGDANIHKLNCCLLFEFRIFLNVTFSRNNFITCVATGSGVLVLNYKIKIKSTHHTGSEPRTRVGYLYGPDTMNSK